MSGDAISTPTWGPWTSSLVRSRTFSTAADPPWSALCPRNNTSTKFASCHSRYSNWRSPRRNAICPLCSACLWCWLVTRGVCRAVPRLVVVCPGVAWRDGKWRTYREATPEPGLVYTIFCRFPKITQRGGVN